MKKHTLLTAAEGVRGLPVWDSSLVTDYAGITTTETESLKEAIREEKNRHEAEIGVFEEKVANLNQKIIQLMNENEALKAELDYREKSTVPLTTPGFDMTKWMKLKEMWEKETTAEREKYKKSRIPMELRYSIST